MLRRIKVNVLQTLKKNYKGYMYLYNVYIYLSGCDYGLYTQWATQFLFKLWLWS